MIKSFELISKYGESWGKAMKLRQSVRKYSGKPVEIEKIRSLRELSIELSELEIETRQKDYAGLNEDGDIPLKSGLKIVVEHVNGDDIFKGFIGSYGKISGATAIAIFIGDESDPNIQEKIGYFGEAMILEATSLGLGTCWVAGTYSKVRLSDVLKEKGIVLGESERIFAISAIGYTLAGFGETTGLMKGLVNSKKRKDLDDICPDYDRVLGKHSLPAWFLSGLEAVQVSPSAINIQPWIYRFFVSRAEKGTVDDSGSDEFIGGRVLISIDTKGLLTKIAMPRLDCGISMLHFEIGSYGSGVLGEWEFSRHPEVSIFHAKRK
jgi:hypothetical protein